jgi:sulfur-carrier protein
MAVSVKIPTQLRAATEGESLARVDGATVGEVLDALYERYAELRSRIAEDGGLRRFVNVYVGGEDIRFLNGLDTPVSDGDEVTILPAVAGGAGPEARPAVTRPRVPGRRPRRRRRSGS